jgi:DNA repair photolyase
MSDHSKIEWTDATWNPLRGCTKISPGCKHCYAETFAERFRGVNGIRTSRASISALSHINTAPRIFADRGFSAGGRSLSYEPEKTGAVALQKTAQISRPRQPGLILEVDQQPGLV